MKYIEKVVLENFQSHKNSIIKFDNQLNIILGPSDSGKTAILRGIKWALYNEPAGDYFIREGETYCSVTIVFSDKTKIKRFRSKSKNIYYLYDSENNEMKFEGFGTTVPKEIVDKIGISKILIDGDQSRAINLSEQLDGAFLLSERGSIRANSIGRLVGVNIIDDSLRETLKDIRNLSNKKRHIDNNVIELEKELVEYDYLKELEKKINKIDIIKNEISKKESLRDKYKRLFEKINIVYKEKKIIESDIEKLKNTDMLNNMINNISNNLINYQYLKEKNDRLHTIRKEASTSINLLGALDSTEKVNGILRNLSNLCNMEYKVGKLYNNYSTNKIEINSYSNILNKLIGLDLLENLITDINYKISDLQKLKVIMIQRSDINQGLEIGNEYLSKFSYINKSLTIYKSLEPKKDLLNKLKSIWKKYEDNKNLILKANSFLLKLNESFDKEMDSYKSILLNQGSCPLCFSNIDEEKVKHIISHYK